MRSMDILGFHRVGAGHCALHAHAAGHAGHALRTQRPAVQQKQRAHCSARTCIAILVVSVLPDPDSPVMTTDWERPSRHMALYAVSAVRNTCGSRPSTPSDGVPRVTYASTTSAVYSGTCQ